MNSVGTAILKTKNDIAKVEKQIETILRGLLTDGILEEGELVPIAGPNVRAQTKAGSSKCEENFSLRNKQIGNIEVEDCQSGAKSKEIAKGSLPATKLVFSVVQESVFLLPVLDSWVFGADFINCAKSSKKLPNVVLNILNAKGNVGCQSSVKSHSYDFKVEVDSLERECELMSKDNEQLIPKYDEVERPEVCVKAGQVFHVSVTFPSPLLETDDDEFAALISIIDEEGKPVWSRSFQLGLYHSVSVDETLLTKFRLPISRAICRHSSVLCVQNVGNFMESLRVDEFLTSFLKFKRLHSEVQQASGRYYCDELALFWGCLVSVQKSENFAPRIFLQTRTVEQLHSLRKALTKWITDQCMETSEDELRITDGNPLSKSAVAAALQKEVKTLIHAIYLNSQSRLPTMRYEGTSAPNPPVASLPTSMPPKTRLRLNWLKVYVNDMNATDQIFMV